MPRTMHAQKTARTEIRRAAGFTLIELTVILVIIGLLVTVGVSAWRMFVDSREMAKVRSQLLQAKQCLIRRAVWSERYPDFQGSGINCVSPDRDVDACLCEAAPDAWNGEIRFLAGFTEDGVPANGQYLVDDPARAQERVRLQASEIVDHTGAVVQDVAFVLVSYGENRQPHVASYFGADRIETMRPNDRPDFSDNDDDIYVFATSRELIAAIRNQ